MNISILKNAAYVLTGKACKNFSSYSNSDDFQDEIALLGIEASPSFVRQPEGNGVADRRYGRGRVPKQAGCGYAR
jgi:hypothetical protein